MSANDDRTDGHLDELALDALRAGQGSAADAGHAAACPHCRAALAGLAVLEGRLRGMEPRIPAVPADVEFRIFRAYRDTVRRREPLTVRSLRRRWALPATGLAAAAALALALRLAPAVGPAGPAPSVVPVRHAATDAAPREAARVAAALPAPAATVDIVDAFLLARALRDGRQLAASWDADGNGTVDGADVQAVARKAVAL